MPAFGYKVETAAYSACNGVCLVLLVLQLWMERYQHLVGNLKHYFHRACLAVVVINAVRVVDLYSVWGLYPANVSNILSVNVTALLLSCGGSFIYNTLEVLAVINKTQGQLSGGALAATAAAGAGGCVGDGIVFVRRAMRVLTINNFVVLNLFAILRFFYSQTWLASMILFWMAFAFTFTLVLGQVGIVSVRNGLDRSINATAAKPSPNPKSPTGRTPPPATTARNALSAGSGGGGGGGGGVGSHGTHVTPQPGHAVADALTGGAVSVLGGPAMSRGNALHHNDMSSIAGPNIFSRGGPGAPPLPGGAFGGGGGANTAGVSLVGVPGVFSRAGPDAIAMAAGLPVGAGTAGDASGAASPNVGEESLLAAPAGIFSRNADGLGGGGVSVVGGPAAIFSRGGAMQTPAPLSPPIAAHRIETATVPAGASPKHAQQPSAVGGTVTPVALARAESHTPSPPKADGAESKDASAAHPPAPQQRPSLVVPGTGSSATPANGGGAAGHHLTVGRPSLGGASPSGVGITGGSSQLVAVAEPSHSGVPSAVPSAAPQPGGGPVTPLMGTERQPRGSLTPPPVLRTPPHGAAAAAAVIAAAPKGPGGGVHRPSLTPPAGVGGAGPVVHRIHVAEHDAPSIIAGAAGPISPRSGNALTVGGGLAPGGGGYTARGVTARGTASYQSKKADLLSKMQTLHQFQIVGTGILTICAVLATVAGAYIVNRPDLVASDPDVYSFSFFAWLQNISLCVLLWWSWMPVNCAALRYGVVQPLAYGQAGQQQAAGWGAAAGGAHGGAHHDDDHRPHALRTPPHSGGRSPMKARVGGTAGAAMPAPGHAKHNSLVIGTSAGVAAALASSTNAPTGAGLAPGHAKSQSVGAFTFGGASSGAAPAASGAGTHAAVMSSSAGGGLALSPDAAHSSGVGGAASSNNAGPPQLVAAGSSGESFPAGLTSSFGGGAGGSTVAAGGIGSQQQPTGGGTMRSSGTAQTGLGAASGVEMTSGRGSTTQNSRTHTHTHTHTALNATYSGLSVGNAGGLSAQQPNTATGSPNTVGTAVSSSAPPTASGMAPAGGDSGMAVVAIEPATTPAMHVSAAAVLPPAATTDPLSARTVAAETTAALRAVHAADLSRGARAATHHPHSAGDDNAGSSSGTDTTPPSASSFAAAASSTLSAAASSAASPPALAFPVLRPIGAGGGLQLSLPLPSGAAAAAMAAPPSPSAAAGSSSGYTMVTGRTPRARLPPLSPGGTAVAPSAGAGAGAGAALPLPAAAPGLLKVESV